MKKRILSLLLTFVMVISLIPTTAWAADGTVTVTFSAQKEGEFLFTPQTVTVQDGLAETYGYTMPTTDHNSVAINAPTVFDAMVAVHKEKYGGAFTSETAKTYLDFNTSGTLTKAFGEAASASGFFVNHDMLNDGISGEYGTTGYMVNAARLNNNDIVDFWFYQSTSWLDHFTYFTDSAKSVVVGATFDLTLTGFLAMSAMGYTPISTPIDGTGIDNTYLAFYAIDESNSSTSLTDITPDANGKVTLSFDTAGTYIVTANGFVGENPAIAPWCIVTVTGAATGGAEGGTPSTPPASTTTADTLTELKLYSSNSDSGLLTLTPTFSSSTTEYSVSLFDYNSFTNLYAAATPSSSEKTVTASWTNNSDNPASVEVGTTRTKLTACIESGPTTRDVTLTVGTGDTATDYTIHIKRAPSLKDLHIVGVPFNETFKSDFYTYTTDTTADSVTFSATAKEPGYTITYNGSTSGVISNLSAGANTVDIVVTNPASGLSTTYTVTINRTATANVTFSITPGDASLVVYDKYHSVVAPGTDGSYPMMVGKEYSYTVTKAGYTSKAGTYTPATEASQTVTVTLETADATGTHTHVTDVAWKNFRNSDVNMAITSAQTPTSADTTALKWAYQFGQDVAQQNRWRTAPKTPIIVGNRLIVMSFDTLYSINLAQITGSTLPADTIKATMKAKNTYGNQPPIYADGLIICQLDGGTIQAFDATTLASVWVYTDPAGGQSLSPITYSDGYIYTGFYLDGKPANYVCLSLTDEDPARTNEPKYATWSKTVPDGFYWAGSVVVGNTLIVGSENGTPDGNTSGTAYLYALNKTTGQEINKLALPDMDDQRSTIAYDHATGRVYFTTKGGYLCSAAVAADGTLSGLKKMSTGAQSTSTPVVYDGYVYVCAGIPGASGSGSFIVADAENLTEVSRVSTRAYPQCSPLLSTAYESNGYLCFYCTYNGYPGGISLIKVDTTTHQATLTELFDPGDGMKQYCYSSIICGTDGTLYYSNDSRYLFAIEVNSTAKAAADAVKDKIDDIGEVTLASESKINAARSAYNALTPAQKELVTNYATLTAAEATLANLKRAAQAAADRAAADAVISKINAVTSAIEGGDTDAIKSAIDDAKTAYNALTAAQKALVTNYDVLTAADSKYNPTGSKHEPVRRQPTATGSGTTGGTTTNPKDDVKSPDTGDSSHMLLWLSGTLLSAAAIAVLTMKKKRSAR